MLVLPPPPHIDAAIQLTTGLLNNCDYVQVGRPDLSGAVDRSLVEEDAPELEALLSQLVSSLQEVRSRIGPLVKEVRLSNVNFASYEKLTLWSHGM